MYNYNCSQDESSVLLVLRGLTQSAKDMIEDHRAELMTKNAESKSRHFHDIMLKIVKVSHKLVVVGAVRV